MDSITALNIVRDNLRTNLVDPYTLAGGSNRGGSVWIFGDEPILTAKYPMVQLKKMDNPSVPIDIGPNYMEYEQLIINVYFYCKNGFKLTENGKEYVNSQAVELYLGKIKSTLKDQFNVLYALCVGGYKHINTTPVEYDANTQLYYGAVTIRVQYFNR